MGSKNSKQKAPAQPATTTAQQRFQQQRPRAHTSAAATGGPGSAGSRLGSGPSTAGGPSANRDQTLALRLRNAPPTATGDRQDNSQRAKPTRQKPQQQQQAPAVLWSSLPVTHRPTFTTYPEAQVKWRPEVVHHLVETRRIAPFRRGLPDEDEAEAPEECTLCMLYYGTGLNMCDKCKQGMCSECLTALIEPDPRKSKCPFCDASPFAVVFNGRRSEEELHRIKEEQEAMQRLERAQLDAAIAAEKDRLERKARGEWVSPPHGPADGATVPSPPPAMPTAELPASAPSDADWADLPPDVRAAIFTEEFTQRLITFYRFWSPHRVPNAPTVSRKCMNPTARQDAMRQLVEKYGPEPSTAEAAADVVCRLECYYQLRDSAVREGDLAGLVERFGAEPWRAMAAVIMMSGPEFDPTAVPLPAGQRQRSRSRRRGPQQQQQQPGGAGSESDDDVDEAASGGAAPVPQEHRTPTRQRSATVGSRPSAGLVSSPSSPTYAQRTATDAARDEMEAELVVESRRRLLVTMFRFRLPHLAADFADLLLRAPALASDADALEELLLMLASRFGDLPTGDELHAEVFARVSHFYCVRVGSARDDVDVLISRFRGREHVLLAALVLKYGPEPEGLALPPAAAAVDTRRLPRSVHEVLRNVVADDAEEGHPAAAAAADAGDDEEDELELALRMSLAHQTEREQQQRDAAVVADSHGRPTAVPVVVNAAAAAPEANDDDDVNLEAAGGEPAAQTGRVASHVDPQPAQPAAGEPTAAGHQQHQRAVPVPKGPLPSLSSSSSIDSDV